MTLVGRVNLAVKNTNMGLTVHIIMLGPELQCLLRVKEDLSIDFSGCEKERLKLIKIKIVLIFLKITMISLTTITTFI